MKSEPSTYSINDLKRDGQTMWEGIRNYQVRNLLRNEVQIGDRVLFYHSNCAEIGAVGEMEVVSEAYGDPTQFDAKSNYFDQDAPADGSRWLAVDVRFIAEFLRTVSLDELKLEPVFANSPLTRKGNRLSVVPLSKEQFERVVALSQK